MFAIATFSGSALRALDSKDEYLVRLSNHIDNAMKVYSRQVGRKEYWRLNLELQKLWGNLAKDYSNVVQETSIPALITSFSYIVQPKDYEAFLGIRLPRYSCSNDDWNKICDSTVRLNDELNLLLGTKSVTLVKPKQKITKVKKQRTKSTKLSTHEKSVIAARERKGRVSSFLKDRVAKATAERQL